MDEQSWIMSVEGSRIGTFNNGVSEALGTRKVEVLKTQIDDACFKVTGDLQN